MQIRWIIGLVVAFFGLTLGLAVSEAEAKCAQDSVQVGKWCVDKYEASVWETTDKGTIKKIQKGQIEDAGDLAGKATQRGANSDDYGAGCPDTGNGCVDFYAVSIPGVTPSRRITWFQAAAACRNAGKELLPNHVWQAAALGTPDPGESAAGSEDCNTRNGGGAGVRGDQVSIHFKLVKGKRGEHVHAYVDGELMGMFKSEKGTLTGVQPGHHVLELKVLAEDHHTEIDATDRIHFVVE